MKHAFAIFITLLFYSYTNADIFKVTLGNSSDDLNILKELEVFDIVSAGRDKDKVTYILNLTPQEALQLKLICNIELLEIKLADNRGSYSSLEEINSRIEAIATEHSDVAEVFSIGHSVENRDIKAIKITSSTQDDPPEILFVGLHHAREWISYEVPLSIAEFIVRNKDSNTFLQQILEKSILWFVPMLNPDGYLFSWEKERMWRYNRKVHPDETIGVDLNRNYDASWIKVDYIHGEAPFSEPETQSIRNLMENDVNSIPEEQGIKSLEGLITYHSFGQLILYPPGSTNEPPQEVEFYKDLGSQMSGHIFSQCGSNYLVMQITGLYNTYGEMTEWFMINNDNKPAFTFELRPHSGDPAGFDLSADQINDTVKENIPAAFYFISSIIEKNSQIEMDPDQNGIADIIQGTEYEYECSRDDLNDDETEDSSSTDNDLIEEIPDKDTSETDTESNTETDDDQTEEKNSGNSGCALTKLI